jgi:predicted small integral membrane protein
MSLPPHEHARRGWLPIETNAFDRIFISVVLFVAINLVWMRFLEAHLALYLAAAISVMIGYFIVRYG